MKRSSTLTRKTPLKARTELKTKAPLKPGSSPLRSQGLRPKAVKPKRRAAARCDYSKQCKSRVSVRLPDFNLCGKHATWIADKLVGDLVKERDEGRCVLGQTFNANPCSGPLQWCHLIPKGRYPSTRWEPLNTVAGCRTHHMGFDASPVQKEQWMRLHLGPKAYEWLQDRAVFHRKPKAADIIEQFRAGRSLAEIRGKADPC